MGRVNPAHIIAVTDFSPHTLREIADHIAASTSFEHFVYREAELDAVWSLTGFAIRWENDPATRNAVALLRNVAHQAHNLIGEERPDEAIAALRSVCFVE